MSHYNVTNTENNSKEEIDDLLLEKENFWIGTLYTIYKGLNDYHDWRQVRRNRKFNSKTAIKLVLIFTKLDFFSRFFTHEKKDLS